MNAETEQKDLVVFKAQKQKLVSALRPFAQLAVEKCPKCEGDGKRFNSKDACLTCGGFGEIVVGFPSPEDVRNAKLLIANL